MLYKPTIKPKGRGKAKRRYGNRRFLKNLSKAKGSLI